MKWDREEAIQNLIEDKVDTLRQWVMQDHEASRTGRAEKGGSGHSESKTEAGYPVKRQFFGEEFEE